MQFNRNKLRGLMVEKDISVHDMAKALGVHPSTFYRKLDPESTFDFTLTEFTLIMDTLGQQPCNLPAFFMTGNSRGASAEVNHDSA